MRFVKVSTRYLPLPTRYVREVVAHYEKVGLAALCEELKVLDPVYYAEVDLNNHKRVIHAIEICRQTVDDIVICVLVG